MVEEQDSQNLEEEPLGHDKRVDGDYAPSHLHPRVSLRTKKNKLKGLLPSLSIKTLGKSGLSVISPRPGHPGKKKRNTLALQSPASTGLTKSRRFPRLVGPACKQDE